MIKAYVILNHELSGNQIIDLKTKYNVDKIIYLPEDLCRFWQQIPAENNLPESKLIDICDWIKRETNENDIVVIQGESGAVFYIVDFCFYINRIPIYSTSIREYEEKHLDDYTVKRSHLFKHVQFRNYLRSKKHK